MGMVEKSRAICLTRRRLLTAAAGFASAALLLPPNEQASADADDAVALIQRLTGKTPTESDRVHLAMPPVFPNGYTVPLALRIDSPMTETDHVRYARVLAPRNPLIEVAAFHFIPQRSEPRVSTRIRLAEPQYVLAVAEMSDGALLLAKTWVKVTINGCK
jgi:sulfur-oxidizing protein SoxY